MLAMGSDEKEPNACLQKFRNRLPQWRLPGSVYFATWHLHSGQLELAPEECQVVVSALLHFNQDRYYLYAYVVMKDHVHVLAKPLGNSDFGKALHSWKSFSANQLQRIHRRKEAYGKKTRSHISSATKRISIQRLSTCLRIRTGAGPKQPITAG